ncbi:MAG: hypothetical protein M3R61_10835 [Chloroflexota bacterium]|nr:hypothetical protein [Chloroflexota bacterium]
MNDWNPLAENTRLELINLDGVIFRQGDRVRLRPRKGGDIFDLALAGKTALIEAIEQDFENRIHLAVIVDDDPGREFGVMRQPGHRFFFAPEEVELLGAESRRDA